MRKEIVQVILVHFKHFIYKNCDDNALNRAILLSKPNGRAHIQKYKIMKNNVISELKH